MPRRLNVLLANGYAVEGWLRRRRNLPLGVSVTCIARATTDPRGLPDPRRA